MTLFRLKFATKAVRLWKSRRGIAQKRGMSARWLGAPPSAMSFGIRVRMNVRHAYIEMLLLPGWGTHLSLNCCRVKAGATDVEVAPASFCATDQQDTLRTELPLCTGKKQNKHIKRPRLIKLAALPGARLFNYCRRVDYTITCPGLLDRGKIYFQILIRPLLQLLFTRTTVP